MSNDINKFKTSDAGNVAVKASKYVEQAALDVANAETPQLIRKVRIDLSVERSAALGNLLKWNYPFQSVYVEEASPDAVIELIPYAQVDGTEGARLRKNDVLRFDLPVLNFGIANEAQPGKTMLLYFFLYSNIEQGSTVIDVNSNVNNITVGGSTVNNFGEGVHLRANTFSLFPDWTDPDTAAANTAYSLNKANTATTLTGQPRYIVPAGKELVITGVDIYNISPMGINVSLQVGAVPLSNIEGVDASIVNANLASWQAWASGGSGYGDSILFSGLFSIFQENKSKAGSPNPFGAFVVPEGHGVAIGLFVLNDNPATNTGVGFEVDVVGLLRDAV